jgi:hypothetical protein
VEHLITAYTVAALTVAPTEDAFPERKRMFAPPPAAAVNWCTPGYKVMVPDGREGIVTSIDGEICRVIADGEAYATLIPHFIVEPVYPQPFKATNFGH